MYFYKLICFQFLQCDHEQFCLQQAGDSLGLLEEDQTVLLLGLTDFLDMVISVKKVSSWSGHMAAHSKGLY